MNNNTNIDETTLHKMSQEFNQLVESKVAEISKRRKSLNQKLNRMKKHQADSSTEYVNTDIEYWEVVELHNKWKEAQSCARKLVKITTEYK